jgi:hypothetical protein
MQTVAALNSYSPIQKYFSNPGQVFKVGLSQFCGVASKTTIPEQFHAINKHFSFYHQPATYQKYPSTLKHASTHYFQSRLLAQPLLIRSQSTASLHSQQYPNHHRHP